MSQTCENDPGPPSRLKDTVKVLWDSEILKMQKKIFRFKVINHRFIFQMGIQKIKIFQKVPCKTQKICK